MKLRLRGNTLRLRLTVGEVAALGAGDEVTEATLFPDGSTLRYRLRADGAEALASQHSQTTAQGLVHEIVVQVPRGDAAIWSTSTVVGFAGEEPMVMGPLNVLIEKDFDCVVPRAGEESLGTFPNPNATDKRVAG